MLLENLPGFPDNLHHIPVSDTFWVGLVARPSKLMQSQLYRSTLLRGIAARLPSKVLDKFAGDVGGGIEFDASGRILQVVVDTAGQVAKATPSGLLLRELNALVMGNLHGKHLSVTYLD